MNQAQFSAPPIDRYNKILIIVCTAFFLTESLLKLAGISLLPFLGLSAKLFFDGFIYQAFTYAFIPHSLMEALFDGLILWFIGSELSTLWGEKKYTQFLLSSIFGGAFLYLAIMLFFFSGSPLNAMPISGPGGICSALCVAYGVLFPERTMLLIFFPVQAKWFVAILVAINLYTGIFSPGGVMAWYQLGAMAAGFGWMWFVSMRSSDKKTKARRKSNHLSLIDGDQPDKDKINYH